MTKLNGRVKSLYFLLIIVSFFLFEGPALADTLGQQVNFNTNITFDKTKRTSVMATLRHVGDKAYFYVEDAYWSRLDTAHQNSLLANIVSLADEFDDNIYPKEVAFWGSEPNPGVDGDPRLTIVFEELVNSNGGYFDTANGYTRGQVADSNQREMIFMNAEVIASDALLTKMFLAHEFQHLISFNQKEKKYNISEEVWLNELRSEYSISKTGFNDVYLNSNLDRRARIFLNNPTDSLTEWPNKNTDYAAVALFAEYLAEQHGDKILSGTITYPETGVASLNKFLSDNKHTERFGDVFVNWLGALYLNDITKNTKLGYRRPELQSFRVAPQQKIVFSSGLREHSLLQPLKDWQGSWLEFDVAALAVDPGLSIRIDLTGESGQNYLASYIARYQSGNVETGRINIVGGRGIGYVLNSGNLQSVTIISTKSTKIAVFGESESSATLGIKVSMIDTGEARAKVLKDGSLIKRPKEKEIYVIWGKYKRYLNPDVISLYGHLNPANAVELEPEVFDSYQTSNYVKYINDEKVYAIWPDGTKHWLNITAKQWDDSRRDWNAIFTINELEVNHYTSGANITR